MYCACLHMQWQNRPYNKDWKWHNTWNNLAKIKCIHIISNLQIQLPHWEQNRAFVDWILQNKAVAVVKGAFSMIYIPSAHQESTCMTPSLLLLQLAIVDMLPMAVSVLFTVQWPASWSQILEFRADVVKSEAGCLFEHKGPDTLVCTLETLKEP